MIKNEQNFQFRLLVTKRLKKQFTKNISRKNRKFEGNFE